MPLHHSIMASVRLFSDASIASFISATHFFALIIHHLLLLPFDFPLAAFLVNALNYVKLCTVFTYVGNS